MLVHFFFPTVLVSWSATNTMAKGVVFQDCSFLRSSLEIVDAAVEIVSYVTAKWIIKQSTILMEMSTLPGYGLWWTDLTMVNNNMFVWGTLNTLSYKLLLVQLNIWFSYQNFCSDQVGSLPPQPNTTRPSHLPGHAPGFDNWSATSSTLFSYSGKKQFLLLDTFCLDRRKMVTQTPINMNHVDMS